MNARNTIWTSQQQEEDVMKYSKWGIIGVAAAALVLVAAPTLAFHDAGVAHCNGCHTMHNSQDGALGDPLLVVP